MNIAILGYGKEGQAVENYFKNLGEKTQTFNNFTREELKKLDLSDFDLVFRSPSVPPLDPNWTSATKYFFDNCTCKIIGVTGTKGKGTTCSLIASTLESLGKTVHLVGNIGNPAINDLNKIQPDDIVVYEMSSFQLWDLNVSPNISVILGIEPDHLNVHKDFNEYIDAKSNITRHQKSEDSCIYNIYNEFSKKIANTSPAKKIPYPLSNRPANLDKLLDSLYIPGQHNRDNAEAALSAVAAFYNKSLTSLINEHFSELQTGLNNFHGLPHRLELIRELNGIKYYDDSFSTNVASTKVAVNAFPNNDLVMIVGGSSKTNYTDLPELSKLLDSENVKKVILIGESGHKLFEDYKNKKFILFETLEDAVKKAKSEAESLANPIVLMSPSAASFDMFESVYDRGDRFVNIVKSL